MQFRALQHINNGGQIIKPGDLIELSEEQAAPLLKNQAIEPVQRRFSKKIVVPGTDD